MTSLSSAISIALSGLQATTSLMQVASNNIANAQTPGYTEKTATLADADLGGEPAGVTVSGFQRATNTALSQSLNGATTSASYLSTQNGYMQQIQSLLDSSSNNPALSAAIAQFQSAWTQYAAAPEQPAQQTEVISAGQNLATQINAISAGVLSLQTQSNSDISTTLDTLNSDLATVASLNSQIVTASGSGQSPDSLLDQRDQLVNQIAGITNVTVMQRPNNQIALYTSDGTVLLDGTQQTFSFNGTDVLNSSGQTVTNDLSGGSLQAQVQFAATSTPPSSLPGVNTLQKLTSQVSALITALTSNSAGPPQTFDNAFNPNATAGADFFNTSGSGIVVNPSLLNGTMNIPAGVGANVAATFTATNDYTASGLSITGATYASLVTSILSGFQAAANTISNQSTAATQQQTFYQQALSNATGVNVDNELVNMTTLQNSYAASAHVISTIEQMFNDVISMVT